MSAMYARTAGHMPAESVPPMSSEKNRTPMCGVRPVKLPISSDIESKAG
jgi:hypothetical protein